MDFQENSTFSALQTKLKTHGQRGSLLLSGISMVALVTAAMTAPVHADESVTDKVIQASPGKKAKIHLFGSNEPSTRGDNGVPFFIRNTYSNTASPGKTTSVKIGSIGGIGGAGDEFLTSYMPGSDGGDGGKIDVAQLGELAGIGTQAKGVPLLWIYSQGGNGGFGYKRQGRGGDGGKVDLTLVADISAQGTSFAGVWARSLGGDAGWGGASEDRIAKDTGGHGGDVTVTVNSNVTVKTNGAGAPAIIAESLGGYGAKHGNNAFSADYVTEGGDAGSVTFTNDGDVATSAPNSTAVLLQSIGGHGGDQGAAGGHPGAKGGVAGGVTATQNGTITTNGQYSFGIVAQSVGGTGGNGGMANFFSGGDGGAAGAGGKVTVVNTGKITTQKTGSTAIIAQSVGGGNALQAFQSTKPQAQTSGGGGTGGQSGIFWGSGGAGGTGGDGGAVKFTNYGIIETYGDSAFGVLAQSVGGSGGRGGKAATGGAFVSVALGGAGGGGGHGGAVTLLPIGYSFSTPKITTHGASATAVIAQSVGGGGGAGGAASSYAAGLVGSVSVAVGGSGGQGGNGGLVDVKNTSELSTTGDDAFGINAQSVGGGGGGAGSANSYAFALPVPGASLPSVSVSVAVGGSGGKGGRGGTVKVENRADITTEGKNGIGLQAQSVGGGGGGGGESGAYALAIAPPGQPAVDISTSIGGSGGGGGNGGDVTANNRAKIKTSGTSAIGVRAMSVGGGGGAAGGATAKSDLLSLYSNYSATVAIGGWNVDGGGNGGDVKATNDGTIETESSFAFGISAQSIGGGGGDGGAVDSAASVGLSFNEYADATVKTLSLAESFTANLGVGGKGGNGGHGGTVTVENTNKISTSGSNATAIFAQSVGGGGGKGGGFQGGGSGTLNGSVTVGGGGGKGGSGNDVEVSNTAKAVIETHAAGSHGILAQSVGGGGGLGGTFTGEKTNAPLVKDGETEFVTQMVEELLRANEIGARYFGKDREWEDAKFFDDNSDPQQFFGNVSKFMNAWKAAIDKDSSVGEKILKTSFFTGLAALQVKYKSQIGEFQKSLQTKDAKKFRDSSLTVSVGGSGGKGGEGGEVTVINGGKITTSADTSFGILAQSVGGGGGAGGGAFADGQNAVNLTVSAGGKGKSGGIGGSVTAKNGGEIQTYGTASYGLFAQSIGGGGGIAGGSSNSSSISTSVNINLGRKDGTGAIGGDVTANNAGTIHTRGVEAHALVAQSVGGGGGAYFINLVDPTKPLDMSTLPKAKLDAMKSAYELLKSIGVVKGDDVGFNPSTTILPKPSLNLALGADGSTGGDSGKVSVTHSGEIETHGIGAFGIFAQSIGGGGGFGTNATQSLGQKETAGAAGGLQGSIGIGGKGGAAGKGGEINLTLGGGASNASIITHANGAGAVFLQSIGGGGGFGGTGAMGLANTAFGKPIRDEGSSGEGGNISVVMGKGSGLFVINTQGYRAHGIHAQSLGGGGGMITDFNGQRLPISTNLTKRQNAKGTGGNISIDAAGAIDIQGPDSYGIFAQSGQQKTDGTLDQSVAGRTIEIKYAGTISGGKGTGAAIRVDGGYDNRIELRSGALISAHSDTAILGSFAREFVTNYGTVIGDIDLVAGGSTEANSFSNAASGTYRSTGNGIVNLGEAGHFSNSGVFDIGGVGTVATAALTGNYDQDLSGRILADIGPRDAAGNPNSDELLVTGEAHVRGVIQPQVGYSLLPGTYAILTASRGLAGTSAQSIRTDTHAIPFRWSVIADRRTLALQPSANFANPGGALGEDQLAVAQALQHSWDASSSGMGPVFASLHNVTTLPEYLAALQDITPEPNHYAGTTRAFDARANLRAVMSCPSFTGTEALLREGDCVYGRINVERSRLSSSADETGFTQSGQVYRIGLQREFRPDWFFGLSGAYSTSERSAADETTGADNQNVDVAAALKHQIGPWLFAASANIGYGWQDNLRGINIGRTQAVASSSTETLSVAGRVRASYQHVMGNWYLRPFIELDALHVHNPEYREHGAPSFNLDILSLNRTIFAFSPNVEIGGRVELDNGVWLRPYGSVGFTWLSEDHFLSRARLEGSGAGGIYFETTTHIPNRLGNIGAGVQIGSNGSIELTAEYQMQIGKNYNSHVGSANLVVRF